MQGETNKLVKQYRNPEIDSLICTHFLYDTGKSMRKGSIF